VVLTDSHGISRAPCYLGYSSKAALQHYGYGAHTLYGRPFKTVHLYQHSHLPGPAEPGQQVPQPRPCNARRLSHMSRFSLIRVRSPLLTESLLFSLPAGTEMFHFPAFPPRTYVFRCGSPDHSRVWRGFPIRTPWDHSPVIDSPRLIADSYVLLRLLMPRHPPCALKNLTTKDQGVIFERTTETNHTQQHHPKRQYHHAQPDPGSYSWKLLLIKDARVHYVVLKQQPRTTHPTHQPPPKEKPPCMIDAARKPETNKPGTGTKHSPRPALLPQDPTVCQTLNRAAPAPAVPQQPPPQRRTTIRTEPGQKPHSRYSLIFHP
jgi:hypothetical protein